MDKLLAKKVLERKLTDTQTTDITQLAKALSLAIWASYSNQHGYVDEKRMAIASQPDSIDSLKYLAAMFDPRNQALLLNMIYLVAEERTGEFATMYLQAWATDFLLPQIASMFLTGDRV